MIVPLSRIVAEDHLRIAIRILLFAGALACVSQAFGAEFTSEYWAGRRYHVKMQGEILSGDDTKFREFVLSELRKGHLLSSIKLNSPGGKVDAALKIGTDIRLLQLTTVAPYKDGDRQYIYLGSFDQLYRDYGAECASSCFLVWASGVGRIGNYVGIHHPYNSKDYYQKVEPAEAERHYQNVTKRVTAYLQEMDVPDDITRKMFRYMSYDIYYLDANELEAMKNSPPWLDELLYSRCGKLPTGSVVKSHPQYNPNRKPVVDCQGRVYDSVLAVTLQRYLDRYANGEKLPDPSQPSIPVTPSPSVPQPTPSPTVSVAAKIVRTDGANSDYHILDNHDLDGIDINPFIKTADQDDCARRCTSNSECVGFSFDSWNSLCVLKSYVTASRLEPSSISGVVKKASSGFPSAIDVAPRMKRYENTTFPGEGYQSTSTSDTNACAIFCMNTQACVTFTYIKATQTCRIFNSSGPFTRGDTSGDSGVKTQSRTD